MKDTQEVKSAQSGTSISFRPSLWAVLSQSNFIASAALMRVLQSVSISCVTLHQGLDMEQWFIHT